MMKIHRTQGGFSIVEIVLIVAVVAIIGILGYVFYSNWQNDKTAENTEHQQATANDVQSAPTISSADDLDEALRTLDETDVAGSNNSDAGQLDNQTADFL